MKELLEDFKDYLKLQKRYWELDIVSRLTLFFSTLVVAFVLVLLIMIILLYLSLTLTSFLTQLLGSDTWAYLIVTLLYVCVTIIVYLTRKRFIVHPLANFLINIFLGRDDEKEE